MVVYTERVPEGRENNINNNVAGAFNGKNFRKECTGNGEPIEKSDVATNSNGESLEKTDIEEKIDRATDYAKDIAMDNSNGYGRGKHGNGEYDCSGLIWASMNAAGILDTIGSGKGLVRELEKKGFKRISYTKVEDLKKGDVVWGPGHFEFYLGNNQTVGARSNYDKRRGDGSGNEIRIDDAKTYYAGMKPNIVIRHEDMIA